MLQENQRKQKRQLKDFIGFAPIFNSPTDKRLTTKGIDLSPLPGTEREVREIHRLYSQDNPQNATLFLDQQATEKTFKTTRIEDYKIVMLSSHGFTNDKQPEYSGIAFYPDSTDKEDDILYSGEMYGLKLNAELVILAGCETGRGEQKLGEGLMGLTRGLFYSGARRILASLWNVSDASTSKLNLNFHKSLTHEENYPWALQKARLTLISNAATAHPYFWSAFVLFGG